MAAPCACGGRVNFRISKFAIRRCRAPCAFAELQSFTREFSMPAARTFNVSPAAQARHVLAQTAAAWGIAPALQREVRGAQLRIRTKPENCISKTELLLGAVVEKVRSGGTFLA
ncbi:hypothetical protein IB278_15830 [Variovorax sp. VRV01]|uniref:hypothetical protein n=1 Tax=Variovorax sp. VRV01 TaxID=2769259 RepID=UPI00177EE926|nr:hypothetical protein [Variovorax sp. VRV01]MBD9665442.1 hypothetical protein [Variovorax sp. VRV01]